MIYVIFLNIDDQLIVDKYETEEAFLSAMKTDPNPADATESYNSMEFVSDEEIFDNGHIEDPERMIVIKGELITDYIKKRADNA